MCLNCFQAGAQWFFTDFDSIGGFISPFFTPIHQRMSLSNRWKDDIALSSFRKSFSNRRR
jgi:hypothetical protein